MYEIRDCDRCVFNSYASRGCCHWDCEFINRDEAVEAWRLLNAKNDNVNQVSNDARKG